MNDSVSGSIVALVTHARDVPSVERSRFAARLRQDRSDDKLVLETCHRVEAYLVDPGEPTGVALATLATFVPDGGSVLVGDAAVRHAVRVAVGRDSVVVGEDQVLHQLRESVEAARRTDGLNPALERLFALALRAGRRSRSWRQGPQRSLADLALSSIARQAGVLPGQKILVVGAGRMGRLAARAAAAAGATVWVANRSADSARSLATLTGAQMEGFDPGRRAGEFAGIIVALGGPWPVGAGTIDGLARGSTIVVDLSMPPAVPDALAGALGGRFVNADALALAESDHIASVEARRDRHRVDDLVDRTTTEFLDWLKGHGGRAAAEALVRRADREREAELAALWRRLPDLQPEARDAIEGMTRHLAERLLREPLERLGRDSDGRDERAVRDIFAL